RELPLDGRPDRRGARLHQLDREDEQEHRGDEEEELPGQSPRRPDLPEDRSEVDVEAGLVLLLRNAELAVDLDHRPLVSGELSRGLGHRVTSRRANMSAQPRGRLQSYLGERARSIRRLRGNDYDGHATGTAGTR